MKNFFENKMNKGNPFINKDDKKGDEINLERAMKISSRFDGHIVSGHIDCTAKVSSIKTDGFSKKIFARIAKTSRKKKQLSAGKA